MKDTQDPRHFAEILTYTKTAGIISTFSAQVYKEYALSCFYI